MTVSAWRGTMKRRLVAVASVFALWVLSIEGRLVFLQVVSRSELVRLAERQQKRTQDAPAKRGDILDRRGRMLATSVDVDSIYAVPSDIGDPAGVASRLCKALGDCSVKDRQQLAERLSNQKAFAFVRRQVDAEVKDRVAALNLDGVGFIKESKRFYPNAELASHLLGWVGIDNLGLGGVEHTYDAQIRGKKGTILIQTDARRHAFSRVERPPTAGSTVELTIDQYLQYLAERELAAGVAENRALGGSAVIMNPHTGEILAMANVPTFNPNEFRDSDETARRNRAIQDLYEPGSTFKVVTASAAIEEKVMTPDDIVDTNPGRFRVAGRDQLITDDGGRNNGVLSFTKVIVKSSNIGAVKIGFRVGTERLSRFVGLYGFGRPVSPDFPAESPGIVWRPDKWTESALASVSMGYQVAITPLQMVAAVASVANGGMFVEPRVVRGVYRNGVRYQVRAKELRRVVSADTAATLTSIMEQVVSDGTAKRARIDGFTIAGKTGTAQKLVNGRYSHSDHNASFVGFAPSRDPQIAMVVVIDSAKGPNGDHGGMVAAPIFQRIAEASLRYLGVAPTVNPVSPVIVARHGASDAATTGTSVETTSQPVVTLVADGPPGTVPDVRGMGARDAVRKLVKLGLNPRMTGHGVVVSQTPHPGEPVEPGAVCRLILDRTGPKSSEAVHP